MRAMIERHAMIQNMQGIHCRPSAVIIKESQDYPGIVEVSNGTHSCDLKSVLGLLSLGLQKGSEVRIRVSGPDEEEMGGRLAALFSKHFDFPPRDSAEDTFVL